MLYRLIAAVLVLGVGTAVYFGVQYAGAALADDPPPAEATGLRVSSTAKGSGSTQAAANSAAESAARALLPSGTTGITVSVSTLPSTRAAAETKTATRTAQSADRDKAIKTAQKAAVEATRFGRNLPTCTDCQTVTTTHTVTTKLQQVTTDVTASRGGTTESAAKSNARAAFESYAKGRPHYISHSITSNVATLQSDGTWLATATGTVTWKQTQYVATVTAERTRYETTYHASATATGTLPSSPTPTPAPTPRPTATPIPTPAPTPIPSGPSFGTATIEAQRYHAGESITPLTLPSATGGSGGLTYSMSTGNGLTFYSSTRILSGTPTAAAGTVGYTYTVTDSAGRKAYLAFTVTVFDIAVELHDLSILVPDGTSLEDGKWGVMDHARVTMQDALPSRTEDYEFQLQARADAGFQMGRRECDWSSPASLQESPWVSSGGDAITIRGKLMENGIAKAEFDLYTTKAIPQAYHVNDNTIDYHIRGLTTKLIGGEPYTYIRGISTTSTEPYNGLFKEAMPQRLVNAGHTMSADLLSIANYDNAADAWDDVKAGVFLNPVSSPDHADVVIVADWEGDGHCGGVACMYMTADYPHLGNKRTLHVEDPPRWGSQPAKKWTTNFKLATDHKTKNDLQYLPTVLMHELGHAIGLAPGHSVGGGVMTDVEPRKALSAHDEEGARAAYRGHRVHQ